MLNKVDARRRWFGALFLILAGGMLAWGLTFLRSYLLHNPFIFLAYWFACFAFTGLAFAVAALDMLIVRRRILEEKQKLMDSSFREVAEKTDQRNHPQK